MSRSRSGLTPMASWPSSPVLTLSAQATNHLAVKVGSCLAACLSIACALKPASSRFVHTSSLPPCKAQTSLSVILLTAPLSNISVPPRPLSFSVGLSAFALTVAAGPFTSCTTRVRSFLEAEPVAGSTQCPLGQGSHASPDVDMLGISFSCPCSCPSVAAFFASFSRRGTKPASPRGAMSGLPIDSSRSFGHLPLRARKIFRLLAVASP